MTIRRDRMGNAEEEFASLATPERPVRLNEHRDLVHRQAHSGNALDEPGQPVSRSADPPCPVVTPRPAARKTRAPGRTG